MPAALAVIPAVASIGIAGASVAAVGLTATSMFAIAGAVGATMGAVGSLTGNKGLQIAGGALGAVGAIGGLAGSMGAFGDGGLFGGESLFGGSEAGTGGASEMGAQVAATNGESQYANVGDLISGQGLTQDVTSSITGLPAPADTLPVNQMTGQVIPQGGGEGGPLGVGGNPAAPSNVMAGVGATPDTPAAPGGGLINETTAGPYKATLGQDAATATVGIKAGEVQPKTLMPDSPSDTWKTISDWIEKHPALALGGVSAMSSFLSGAFNPKTPAETSALQAQAGQSTAQTGLINSQNQLLQMQTANMQQPIPSATRTPLPRTALINTAPRAA